MAIQDKTVKYTTPSKTAITLVEDTIDNTTTSLVFPHQDYVNINRIVNNNLIHLVENFCSVTAPSPPIEGQLWLDTGDPDNKQELGRLKIYMHQDTGMKFMDVAGTVMDKFGNLRHTGHIEAFNDLNNIPKNVNEFPDDPDYYKFLTTKAHCDSNYLSGYYSTDNTEFFIRGNRPVTYTKELIYGAPFNTKDSRTLVQKKFADMYYLFGVSNSDTTFNITNDKKLYYDNSIEMTQDFQLITKTKCDDKFAETISKVTNLSSSIKGIADKIKKIANDPLDTTDLAHSGAIALANEVKRLVAARPKPQNPTPATLCGNTGVITISPPVTTSFTTLPLTDEYHTYTVPADVHAIDVILVGGGGGGGGWDSRPHTGGSGGDGDRVSVAAIPVTPGEVLRVYIGVGGAGGTTGDTTAGVLKGRAPLNIGASKLPILLNSTTLLSMPNMTPPFVKRTYGSPWPVWLQNNAVWKDKSEAATVTVTWNVPFTVPRTADYMITGNADDQVKLSIDGVEILDSNGLSTIRSTVAPLTKGNHTLTIVGINRNNPSPAGIAMEIAEMGSGFSHGGIGGYHSTVVGSNVGSGGGGGGSSAIVRDTTGEVLVVAAGGGGGGGGDWNHNGYDATTLTSGAYTNNPISADINRGNGGGGGGGYDLQGGVNVGNGKGGDAASISGMEGGKGGNKGASYIPPGLTFTVSPAGNKGNTSSSKVTGDGSIGSVSITTVVTVPAGT